jgi:hypothetical protein
MLAAFSRRASRIFLGLTLATALCVGLFLTPPWAEGSPAQAVGSGYDAVQVSICPSTGSGVSEGEELAVTVSLVNHSRTDIPAGQIVVTTGSSVLSDAVALEEWLAKNDDEQQPGRWVGVIDAPGLSAGASANVTASFPLDNALYGTDWGPRGLAADLEIAGDSAGSGRGVVIWAVPNAGETARIVTLLPIVSPPSASGLLTAAELAALTAPRGTLTMQLAAATGRTVTLAVDPRILASIRALGNEAPESAAAWLDRLVALPNESFSLAYADADVALQSQAGATELLTASFSDQALVSANPISTSKPSPSASPSTSAQPGTFVEEGVWLPALTGIAWPASNTVTSGDLPVFAASGAPLSILSSSNINSIAPSPALVTVGNQRALITGAGLSEAMQNAASAVSDSEWAHSFSLASAYLASTALNAGDDGTTLAALTRDQIGDVSEARLTQTLDRVSALPWVEGGSLTSISTQASTQVSPPIATIIDRPESEERVAAARVIGQSHNALAAFSTVLTTPKMLTDATSRQELALLSLAWTAAGDVAAATNIYLRESSKTLNSIRIVISSEIQMVGGQVNIPVTIENALPLPVTVLVKATPSNARLTVDSDATITVQGESQGKALVPVIARIGNGNVSLAVTLSSPSGVSIGAPTSLPVNVRADWESWGLGGLGIIFAGLLVTGVIRTVRKRRTAEKASGRE